MAEEIKFKREYYLHMLTQRHLKCLFDLEFVASEIQRKKLRFDNLAFDEKTTSFVIIEYKNKFDSNVLNQAQEYSDLIQEDKEYFLDRLDRDVDVDFKNTKIMIISPKFSQNQIDEAKDNFELWKVTLFDDCRVTYENLKNNDRRLLKIKPGELKISDDMLLENKTKEVKDLYENFRENLLNEFSDVEITPLVNQFSCKVNNDLICLVEFLKSSFNIYFYADNLKDADNLIDISKKSTGGKSNYKLKYDSNDDFNCFLELFKQTMECKK